MRTTSCQRHHLTGMINEALKTLIPHPRLPTWLSQRPKGHHCQGTQNADCRVLQDTSLSLGRPTAGHGARALILQAPVWP